MHGYIYVYSVKASANGRGGVETDLFHDAEKTFIQNCMELKSFIDLSKT